MADYVNAPADEETNGLKKRGSCAWGASKVFVVVGVSFGLLCIVQSVLNISLRLQGMGTDHINVPLMSAANISALVQGRDQLAEENRKLQANINNLTGYNQVLQWRIYLSDVQTKSLERKNRILERRLSDIEERIRSCPYVSSYMSTCDPLPAVSIPTSRPRFTD